MEDGQLAAVPLKYRAGVHSHKCRLRLFMVAVCPVLAPVYNVSHTLNLVISLSKYY